MSAQASPSPRHGPTLQVDESPLPQGQCHFILLQGEAKGLRCPCVTFIRNRGIPGATCDCGHQACYHNRESEPSDVDVLKRRIQALEDRLAQVTNDDTLHNMLIRVGGMEDEIERSREEFNQEIKRAYSNTTPLWASYHQVQRKVHAQEEQLSRAKGRFDEIDTALKRLDDRQLELQDADISLEERIENIVEAMEDENFNPLARGRATRRRRSTSDARRPSLLNNPQDPSRPSGVTQAPSTALPELTARSESIREMYSAFEAPISPLLMASIPIRAGAASLKDDIWTVHVSLIPHTTIPMPFEKNTNAYQRCLSRGLHQLVTIRGCTAEAFSTAVTNAFGPLLKGRPWMPLQARLCDAQQLQGLPMLRQLEPDLIDSSYTVEFLRQNCAVFDEVDSLYITMREPHVLSWHALRHAAVVVNGLEECWNYDPLLDNDPFDGEVVIDDDDRPAAGDLLPALPSLKRSASQMVRSTSFGSATAPPVEGVAVRSKRACPPPRSAILNVRQPGLGAA